MSCNAQREQCTQAYLHSDHLGTASLTTDSSQAVKHQVRHYPFGGQRWSSGDVSDYDFTGQRLDGFGLLDYNARYYDSVIGRFISADTVVPDFANPQDLNRYSYVRNNPVRFTDPTGHYLFEDEPDDRFTWHRDKEQLELVKASSPDSLFEWEESVNHLPDADIPVEFPDNGTFSVGYSGVLFCAVGGNYGGTLNFDTEGNWSFMLGGGGGGYTAAGGSTGFNAMITNAPSVYDLQDDSVHLGGQVGEGIAPGAEWVIFKGQNEQVYHGLNVTGSAALFGPWPGELHATVEHDL